MKKNKLIYAGIDGCKAGWIMVKNVGADYAFEIWECLSELVLANGDVQRFLIDIPIGLGSQLYPRTIDQVLRSELGKRGSTVFNAPVRDAVYTKNYAEAKTKNIAVEGKSISIQSFNICAKIRETDTFLAQNNSIKIIESHPELCFKYLNGGELVISKKTSPEGAQQRLNILSQYDPKISELFQKIVSETKRKHVKKDDILDAICLCLANRLATDNLHFLMDKNLLDEKGIEIKIAYFVP